MCLCVLVCVCARVRACMGAWVRACVYSSNQLCAVENCEVGHGYNFTSGACEPCPRGTYRLLRLTGANVPMTPQCKPCPEGKTTKRTGTVSKDSCDIGACHKLNIVCNQTHSYLALGKLLKWMWFNLQGTVQYPDLKIGLSDHPPVDCLPSDASWHAGWTTFVVKCSQ